jgi:hypothetical protein
MASIEGMGSLRLNRSSTTAGKDIQVSELPYFHINKTTRFAGALLAELGTSEKVLLK